MGAIASILEEKDTTIRAVGPEATVFDAVGEMCRNHVRALLVEEHGAPVGIISERDIMMRVLLERRDPSTTTVADVMTRDIVCIRPDREPEEAMTLMAERHVRHLPVVDFGVVIGIVSMGDLVQWTNHNQEYEIRALKQYVYGGYS